MAEAFPRSESDDFPLVPGDYDLIDATPQSSDEYLSFCYALYGGGPDKECLYKMYANSDGKLTLFPRMVEGDEVWDYTYNSVLRKVRITFQIGVPFEEMQDDCVNTDTTATLIHPDTMLLTHTRQNGQVYTTKMEFESTRMMATHEYNGVTAHRIWRRIVGGFVVEDLVRVGKRALRVSQEQGESSPPDLSGSGQISSSNSESPNEDPDIIHFKTSRRESSRSENEVSGGSRK